MTVEFRSARSLEEALDWLEEIGVEAQVLAGGTDVMIQSMRHEIAPSFLLHIGRLDQLRGIARNGALDIGPLSTHRMLATNHTVQTALPALAEAAGSVGGWQTQEVGTVGGNLCNASPAADTAPPLLVANAHLRLHSKSGARELPLGEFLLGRRRTARRADELLTGITAEPCTPGTGEAYLKLGRRSAMEVAIVGVAVRLTLDGSNTVTEARVATCSVAPRPFRASSAEDILRGTKLEPASIAEAGLMLVEEASPIDDGRASAAYRRRVLPDLLARTIEICRSRIADQRKDEAC
jgi:carbon-monoxide dehydrogenase medium subunit